MDARKSYAPLATKLKRKTDSVEAKQSELEKLKQTVKPKLTAKVEANNALEGLIKNLEDTNNIDLKDPKAAVTELENKGAKRYKQTSEDEERTYDGELKRLQRLVDTIQKNITKLEEQILEARKKLDLANEEVDDVEQKVKDGEESVKDLQEERDAVKVPADKAKDQLERVIEAERRRRNRVRMVQKGQGGIRFSCIHQNLCCYQFLTKIDFSLFIMANRIHQIGPRVFIA